MQKPKIDLNLAATLASEVEAAMKLNREGHHREARDALVRIKKVVADAGVEAPFLCWCCAVVADALEDGEAALRYATLAVNLDPCCAPYQNSRRIIIERIKNTVVYAPPRSKIVREYFGLLEQIGEVDGHALYALAAHHVVVGDAPAALAVLDKLVLVADYPAIWETKAVVHDQLGEHGLARDCRQRAAQLPAANVPPATA